MDIHILPPRRKSHVSSRVSAASSPFLTTFFPLLCPLFPPKRSHFPFMSGTPGTRWEKGAGGLAPRSPRGCATSGAVTFARD